MPRRNTPPAYKKPCLKCEEEGKEHKVYRVGYDFCWRHLSRSKRDLIRREQALQVGGRLGYYTDHLSDAMKLLRLRAEQTGKITDLSGADISQELVLIRLLLADWLEKHRDIQELPLKDLSDVVNTISKIAKTAQTIGEYDQGSLSEEMMRAIITAISHAFHKANLHSTPEERAAVFAHEIAGVFAGEPSPKHPPSLPPGDRSRPTYVDGEVQAVQ